MNSLCARVASRLNISESAALQALNALGITTAKTHAERAEAIRRVRAMRDAGDLGVAEAEALGGARLAVEEAQAALDAAKARRNSLIVEAMDAGVRPERAARIAGVSKAWAARVRAEAVRAV